MAMTGIPMLVMRYDPVMPAILTWEVRISRQKSATSDQHQKADSKKQASRQQAANSKHTTATDKKAHTASTQQEADSSKHNSKQPTASSQQQADQIKADNEFSSIALALHSIPEHALAFRYLPSKARSCLTVSLTLASLLFRSPLPFYSFAHPCLFTVSLTLASFLFRSPLPR
jgi:hypothetical protein